MLCSRTVKIVVFEAPFGGLRATYALHLRLIGKLVGDFLLVITELFSLRAFVLSHFTHVTDRRTDGTALPSRRPRLHTMQCGKNCIAAAVLHLGSGAKALQLKYDIL